MCQVELFYRITGEPKKTKKFSLVLRLKVLISFFGTAKFNGSSFLYMLLLFSLLFKELQCEHYSH